MDNSHTYSTKNAAVRAARQACKEATGSEIYQAYEGPDYYIHPVSSPTYEWLGYRYRFELSPVMLAEKEKR
jgi:hypothetical protein